jgi:glutamine amidotransferase
MQLMAEKSEEFGEFDGLNKKRDFYFVNSFHFNLKNKNLVLAETEYEEKFCSVFQKENIIGVQFHPEKSQESGKIFIKNFLNLK